MSLILDTLPSREAGGSRSSGMQYKGVNRPVRDIAHELGVDGILEGSVERYANRVHMTGQLIYAPTDTHLWAQSYNRDETQALSLPEELSQVVAKEVKITTSLRPRPAASPFLKSSEQKSGAPKCATE